LTELPWPCCTVNVASGKILPGSAASLGALFDGQGTNFAVFAAGATQVWLCLFDTAGNEERIELTEVDAYVWHCYLPGVGAGQRYAYRVAGGWDPGQGKRWNVAKLLLDPYALAVNGPLDWGSSDADAERLFDYRWADGSQSSLDSGPAIPRCVVIDRSFNWGDNEVRPYRELADTVIYETHVRAFTCQHPSLTPAERGTYKGLAHPDVLNYLKDLGVTAVELMPVQQFFANRSEINFWGYNPICWLAPHHAYASAGYAGEQVTEFKQMVRALHEAGFEVLMDVVFNHTFEGGNPSQDPPDPLPLWRVGPSLSFRGIDNRSYYMLDSNQLTYINKTGVGNTVNVWDPAALRLVMDALRYWVTDMHIDGFRFDEAAVLAETDGTHSISAFLYELGQDPVLSQVKLIAEPWFGDQEPQMLGQFPPLWSQWNGNFHWEIRDFWKSTGSLRQMTDGLLGSPEIFQASAGEFPTASVNYAASHDGLTTRDAVSYNDDAQHAWDCISGGQAGDDPAVLELRNQLQRAHIATAVLAQGIPMLAYGDECGRTQNGNPNPYDIDSPVTWMPWGTGQDEQLLAFTQRLTTLRRNHPVFRRRRFFQTGGGVSFYRPDGTEMVDSDLDASGPCAAAMFLDGEAIPDPDTQGNLIRDTHSFLLLLNANWQEIQFSIPGALGSNWQAEITTENPDGSAASTQLPLLRPGRSLLVLSTATAG
jgi:isoamylase